MIDNMTKTTNIRVAYATKWSSYAELCAKLVLPITNLVLARLLTPEMFGVVATVTMIVSLADLFTDAGFQRYLVQHEYENEKQLFEGTTVAFWSNLVLSMALIVVIFFLRNKLAAAVGNDGLGNALFVACISLPLTSFSSIQTALFKRQFEFKTLFYARCIGLIVPIVVTIPLAAVTHSYWALIFGTLCQNIANAIFLTIKSKWKPNFFFSLKLLNGMLSFSIWTTIEQVTIWLTNYLDIFIVGVCLSEYYLGIYRTSMTTVNAITSVIVSAIAPVLFSALSRLQNDTVAFEDMFLKFQRMTGYLVIPLSAGIVLYRDLIVKILLGNQWNDAIGFVGLWGCFSSITILFSHFFSEAYRAKGKPRLSVIVQILHLIVLIPVVYITAQYSFTELYIARALVRLELIFVNIIVMHLTIKIGFTSMLKNLLESIISTLVMICVSLVLMQVASGLVWQITSVIVCIIVYAICLLLFSKPREELRPYYNRVMTNILNRGKYNDK